MAQYYSDNEIREMAKEIMESLRPKHLAVYQIRELAEELMNLTDFIVLREVPAEN